MKTLDIIVPVRNEEKNIVPLVTRVHGVMRKSNLSYNLIFIDDHSTDKTVHQLVTLQKVYPIKIYSKQGKRGKAYSIFEGARHSVSEYLVMIDADLQYPPEAIPEMFSMAHKHGVIVARRSQYDESKLRKLISRSFSSIFGNLLHGLKADVQSGLKLFRREILLNINQEKVTPWTLDLSLLLTAKDMGYSIGEIEIKFGKRENGVSNVNLVKTSLEIGLNALKLKFGRSRVFPITTSKDSMVGAGYYYKGKKLITHTTLGHQYSALETFSRDQKIFFFGLLLILAVDLFFEPKLTLTLIIGFLSAIYFIDVLFNLFVVLKSLHFPPELSFSSKRINLLEDRQLPIYTILCPMYKESGILPNFVSSIEKLDWPKNKLDVLLLLEQDDRETIRAARDMKLPSYFKILVVPDSLPKTKPKACNFGLSYAKGEYLVIYDAEDIPEKDQLKKAYLGFKESPDNVVCLQAKLNYFNPNQNLLTRMFTAEYSLWFDIILTGLQSIDTTIPLGGTSNHFKTEILRKIKGWDPLNVTEDCDLGVRLFKLGFKTAIINSTTYEEANSQVKNWIRQRSRWIKGYMQTYLVHTKHPIEFIKTQGIHALIFQLVIGARITFMLINPFLWLITISYFALYSFVGPTIESLYPTGVFYVAVFSLIFGNFMYVYNYMIGCAKKGHWELIKYIYLIPIYWCLASWASYIAFYQLLVKPYYWEKTNHGLAALPKKSKILQPFLKPIFAPIRQAFNIF